jgi:hypothetical protein
MINAYLIVVCGKAFLLLSIMTILNYDRFSYGCLRTELSKLFAFSISKHNRLSSEYLWTQATASAQYIFDDIDDNRVDLPHIC